METVDVELIDRIRSWQRGWGVCRGFPPATEDGDALRVAVGLPGRQVELIALRGDEHASLARLADEVVGAAEPTWLTVPTRVPEDVRQAFGKAGLEQAIEAETMMIAELSRHPSAEPPAGYAVRLDGEGARAEVRVEDAAGAAAARGTVAVLGGVAVAHDIRTEPEHRRRGLASVVMSALAAYARDAGASTGLLVASPAGERLYTALGWTALATVMVGRLPTP